jgi:hypothetical protein
MIQWSAACHQSSLQSNSYLFRTKSSNFMSTRKWNSSHGAARTPHLLAVGAAFCGFLKSIPLEVLFHQHLPRWAVPFSPRCFRSLFFWFRSWFLTTTASRSPRRRRLRLPSPSTPKRSPKSSTLPSIPSRHSKTSFSATVRRFLTPIFPVVGKWVTCHFNMNFQVPFVKFLYLNHICCCRIIDRWRQSEHGGSFSFPSARWRCRKYGSRWYVSNNSTVLFVAIDFSRFIFPPRASDLNSF